MAKKNIPYTPDSFHGYADRAPLQYSSEGRFSLPGQLYFGQYSSNHVISLTLAGEEDTLKTIVEILDDLKKGDESGAKESMANATIEELTETLIHLYVAFDSELAEKHTHSWVCKCQDHLPDELKKINETKMNLNEIEFRTISEADQDFKDLTKEQLESYNDEQFESYLNQKYGDQPDRPKTKEEETNSIKIKDNVILIDRETGIRYEFMYPRFGHIIRAFDLANQKWRWEIQKAKNKKAKTEEHHNKNQVEINKLEELRAKDVMRYLRSLQIVSINGVDIKTDEEKIQVEENNRIPARIKEDLIVYQNYIDFGINSEIEFECPICGEKDRRLLRQEINFRELLPLHRDSFESDTKAKPRQNNRILTFFG